MMSPAEENNAKLYFIGHMTVERYKTLLGVHEVFGEVK